MLCGMTSDSGSVQPGAVSIPQGTLTPRGASTAALGAKVSAPGHSQHLPFMKLSATILLIHSSLEVLVAAQTCWLSFSSLGSLQSYVNMDRSLGAFWTSTGKKSRPQVGCSATWDGSPHIDQGLAVCTVEWALGLGLCGPESAFRSGNLRADSCLQVLTDTLGPFCAYHLDFFHVHHRKE